MLSLFQKCCPCGSSSLATTTIDPPPFPTESEWDSATKEMAGRMFSQADALKKRADKLYNDRHKRRDLRLVKYGEVSWWADTTHKLKQCRYKTGQADIQKYQQVLEGVKKLVHKYDPANDTNMDLPGNDFPVFHVNHDLMEVLPHDHNMDDLPSLPSLPSSRQSSENVQILADEADALMKEAEELFENGHVQDHTEEDWKILTTDRLEWAKNQKIKLGIFYDMNVLNSVRDAIRTQRSKHDPNYILHLDQFPAVPGTDDEAERSIVDEMELNDMEKYRRDMTLYTENAQPSDSSTCTDEGKYQSQL